MPPSGSADAAKAAARAAKAKGRKGLTPCQKLLLILGLMIAAFGVLFALTVLYPSTESQYSRRVRSLLKPIMGESNPALERHLVDAAVNMEKAEMYKAKLEKALEVKLDSPRT